MKVRCFALFATMIVSSALWAQDKEIQDPVTSKELNTEAYIQLIRADIRAERAEIIKQEMRLDEKQMAAFWPIYEQYSAEQTRLADEKLGVIKDYAKDFLTMNDEKADSLAQRIMAIDDQRAALRKKYYEQMKKVLPTVLVVRFFQVDNQLQMLLDLQLAANLPIIEEAPPQAAAK